MALNLNKDGNENNSSLPKQEKKSLNLNKEENKSASKLNLSKDSIESEKNNSIPEKKNLNLSKDQNKSVSKFNLSKDPIEHAKDTIAAEKKESNISTSKVIEDQPKKKSKTLMYSLLGLVIIALAVLFISNNKKPSEGPQNGEIPVAEAPTTSPAVIETPTVVTPVTENPAVENTVTETSAAANTVAETPIVETLVAENSIEQFASGTSVVNSPNNQQVKSIKDYLEKNASNKIILIGYASSEGEINFNKLLSEKRAQSMKDYLTSNGIDGTRISSQGGGIENPVGDNNTEEGRTKNRRVEVMFK